MKACVTHRDCARSYKATMERPANYTANTLKSLRISLLTLLLAPSLSALAANQREPAHEAVYRCKDANGQTHFGDSVPAECAGRDTEVLSARGTVLRVIEGDTTRAAHVERDAEAKKAAQEDSARALHDRMLLDTYLTVEDIERLRDQRLDILTQQSRITEQSVAALRERESRLNTQIARFKPYNTAQNAPPLPDHLAEDMVNTINGLDVYRQTLEQNRAEQKVVKESFARDINRFKELKGIN
jgi:Domain of unknown function (DUF4124)